MHTSVGDIKHGVGNLGGSQIFWDLVVLLVCQRRCREDRDFCQISSSYPL